MNHVLYRLSRSPCSPPDRRWVSAFFAEMAAMESRRARLLWLTGAAGMLLGHYVTYVASLLTPVSIACVAGTAVFGLMALTEYEGLAIEDDWFPLITAASAASLVCVSILNLRRQARAYRP